MATPRGLALAVCFALLAAAASATQFRVGGQKGWSVPDAGAEPFNAWAGRMRFHIGDQLLFGYPKGADSVLLVEPAAYNACNTSAYDKKFDDGATVFTLDRSGPFFFISGNDASCRANEKLIVVVLADRSGTRTPPAPTPSTTPPPAPNPSSSPPAATPQPSPSSPPAATPQPSPSSPPAATPLPSPASPPSTTAPAPAPTATPSSPPASAPASAPSTTPGSPPSPPTLAPSTSPATPGGVPQPPSASANAPGAAGGGSTTPPAPSGAAPAVAGVVGSLGAYVAYAMLAI